MSDDVKQPPAGNVRYLRPVIVGARPVRALPIARPGGDGSSMQILEDILSAADNGNQHAVRLLSKRLKGKP